MLAGTNWNEWVGVGTLALAFSTLILAFVTAAGVRVANRSAKETRQLAETAETEARAVLDQAAATREQAEAARMTVLASIQPLLGPAPVGVDDADPDADIGDVKIRVHEPNMLVSLPLRNVGTGVALITRAVLEADDVPRRHRLYARSEEVPEPPAIER